jgi:hypothetical protein
MESSLLNVKNWYKPGTVPSTVAVYKDDVVSSVLDKSKAVSPKFARFLPNLLDSGKMLTELYSNFAQDEMYYNFKNDVAQQANHFEYYKVIEIVEFWGANNLLYATLPTKEQQDILADYESYKVLVGKLNSTEKKFLHDVLKLVGGVASAEVPENDSAQNYNELTNTVHKLEPLLPAMSKKSSNKTIKKTNKNSRGTRKRPRGRAPKGKKWDYENGDWVNL